LYQYKTLFVNHKNKAEALQELWSQFNSEALSIWFIHYEKMEGEFTTHVATKNFMTGFISRIDDKLRKHALGVFGIYGEEPNLDVMGVIMWRGTEIPLPLHEHPQMEYCNKR
jgi:hypothetical protein